MVNLSIHFIEDIKLRSRNAIRNLMIWKLTNDASLLKQDSNPNTNVPVETYIFPHNAHVKVARGPILPKSTA